MRLLLDTHAFLWFQAGDRRLSRKARAAMEAPGAELILSAAIAWEMAIKASLDRLRLPDTVEGYLAEKVGQGYRVLLVSWTHAAKVEALPWHHRDPFDRLLASQALTEDLPLVTRDPVFRRYGVTTVW
ncbi:MAG: type II toxin-antitoxin system VapC family toxin [Acidobacteriota bacterium]